MISFILLTLFFVFGVPLIFVIIGINKQKSDRQKAMGLYILAAVWLIAGAGFCSSILNA